jgi:hypothetical protein
MRDPRPVAGRITREETFSAQPSSIASTPRSPEAQSTGPRAARAVAPQREKEAALAAQSLTSRLFIARRHPFLR